MSFICIECEQHLLTKLKTYCPFQQDDFFSSFLPSICNHLCDTRTKFGTNLIKLASPTNYLSLVLS
jgi:hypothetical protein